MFGAGPGAAVVGVAQVPVSVRFDGLSAAMAASESCPDQRLELGTQPVMLCRVATLLPGAPGLVLLPCVGWAAGSVRQLGAAGDRADLEASQAMSLSLRRWQLAQSGQ